MRSSYHICATCKQLFSTRCGESSPNGSLLRRHSGLIPSILRSSASPRCRWQTDQPLPTVYKARQHDKGSDRQQPVLVHYLAPRLQHSRHLAAGRG